MHQNVHTIVLCIVPVIVGENPYQRLWFQFQVSEARIPGENTDVELLRVQVLHVPAQEAVQKCRYSPLEHRRRRLPQGTVPLVSVPHANQTTRSTEINLALPVIIITSRLLQIRKIIQSCATLPQSLLISNFVFAAMSISI